MTTYNTYQEAKIENPNKEIIRFDKQDEFKAVSDDELSAYLTTWTKCDPADHCMTVERFLADGHKFVKGDAVLDVGDVCLIESGFDLGAYNDPYDGDSKIFILRAAALENIPTETPEEKEVLDGIESAGEVEWKNGDDVDAYGKPYKYVGLDPFNENLCICLANQDDDPQCFSIDILKKPETPQQRKDRERLEAAYDLYVHIQSVREKLSCKFDWFFSPGMEETRLRFLAIVDKTNYRKEKAHGTN